MTYEEAVQKKKLENRHKYTPKVVVQTDYEQRNFLWFDYKKKVGEKHITVALCDICNKLEFEHQNA